MEPIPILIYIRDLMFSGKVVASARAAGAAFKVVRDAPKLLETPAPRLIVDLNADGALETAIDWKARHQGQVIGFVSHVASETIQKAKESGIDRVMSNGAFSSQIDEILRETIQGTLPE